MIRLKEKLNKSNILVAATIILSATVIGQSIYIAQLYGNENTTTVKPSKSVQLSDKASQINKPHNIFDDFDAKFMSNHFKEFRKIKEHIDKVFDDAFSEFNIKSGIDDDFSNIFGRSKFKNNLDLELQNEPEKLTVTLRLPNSQKNNVQVKLDGQKLTVFGDMKEQIEESTDYGKQYREFSSKFSRSIVLPGKVNENTLSTKFKNDKLIITVQKNESA